METVNAIQNVPASCFKDLFEIKTIQVNEEKIKITQNELSFFVITHTYIHSALQNQEEEKKIKNVDSAIRSNLRIHFVNLLFAQCLNNNYYNKTIIRMGIF